MHAPHSGDKCNLSAWWEDAEQDMHKLRSLYPDVPILNMSDCNARPSAPDGLRIGNARVHKWSATAPYLRRFVHNLRLSIPATFEINISPGAEKGTYYWDAHMDPVMIDHILVTDDVYVCPASYGTNYIENGKYKPDHISPYLDIHLQAKSRASGLKKTYPKV